MNESSTILPADVFLSPTMTAETAAAYLASLGFHDPSAADDRLQAMAEDLVVRETLGAMAVQLFGSLGKASDPDRALEGFARYLKTCVSQMAFLRHLSTDPRALDVLARIFGGSPLLTDILIRNPEYFHWLLPQVDRGAQTAAGRERYLDALLTTLDGVVPSLDALRRLKRRELLGIAARELLGRDPVAAAKTQLSGLADMLIQHALGLVCRAACSGAGLRNIPGTMAIIATGKLGGRELDYVSGIDLLYVYAAQDPSDAAADGLFQDIARRLTAVLVDDAAESELYRVDVPAGPGGPTNRLAHSIEQWEAGIVRSGSSGRFALVKARQVAGDRALGDRFLTLAEPFVYGEALEREHADEMVRLHRSQDPLKALELFVTTLQLTHGADHRDLRGSGTAEALTALGAGGFITREAHDALAAALTFLRTVEHRLQLLQEADGRLPDDREQTSCARQLGFRSPAALSAEIDAHRERVQAFCSAW